MDRRDTYLIWATLLIACGFYLAACVLPATKHWEHDGSPHGITQHNYRCVTYQGWPLLAVGWTGVLGGQLAWLANPAALASTILLLCRQWLGAATLGAVSVILGASYLIFPTVSNNQPDVPQVGAVLWVCSFVVLTVAALIRCTWRRRERDEPRVAADGKGISASPTV